ncbi:MAG: methyltransferase domain-containing protein [Spirochaetaceae bacterium]|jgi:SAM-dependent methyltransferase|nr:methyltransferase domain-containing protein [Spirochaetaceae bacterium]
MEPLGGIDWNEIWKEAQRKNRDSGKGGECWTSWADREAAERYARTFAESPQGRKRIAEALRMVRPAWRVLDIGAGPGAMAAACAKKAAQVTALEPAPGMAAVFMDAVRRESLENIRLIRKRWEDIDPAADLEAPYDLCFASFSLGMLDLQASIEKMAQVSRRIVLYWHAGPQSFDEDAAALSRMLQGAEHYPVPEGGVIFNLLYSMGIYPDVKVTRAKVRQVYDSFEDVFALYARRFAAASAAQQKALAGYLRGVFMPYEGKKVIRLTNKVSMRISFRPLRPLRGF